ncbi:hypothetical protein [Rothia amarae]|uniref:phage major capsid protein n=1 Tax=Rothia amarae TaxID=169480 RepID=UPI0031D1F405
MANQKILEAVQTFKAGLHGTPMAQAQLLEAMSTSDFAPRLGAGFEIQMLDIWKETEKEWQGIAKRVVVPDFRPIKLGTFLNGTDLLPVNEGEEYKAQGLTESNVEIKAEKMGRRRQWTYELEKARAFSVLANIPRDFADAAVKAENTAAFKSLVDAKGALNTSFFTGAAKPTNLPLNAENLEDAYRSLALRKGIDGVKTADVSDLYLVVHPAQLFAANRIVNAETIEVTNGTVKTTEANPFRGLVKVIAPQTLANLGMDVNAWFLLPGSASQNPALGIAFMQGEETPDIRVKNDQGFRVGGGNIAPEEGSYIDDTIDFRVRHIVGGTTLFNHAAYASAGK